MSCSYEEFIEVSREESKELKGELMTPSNCGTSTAFLFAKTTALLLWQAASPAGFCFYTGAGLLLLLLPGKQAFQLQ
jgi:hypothetical protein